MVCTLTADPTQVDYAQGKMIVTITPSKFFPSDTTFLITVPTYWPRSSLNSSYNQIMNATSQPSCLSVSSNVQSNIACSVTSSSMIFVTVTNVLSAKTLTSITFSLSQIRTPPTVEPQGGF